MAEFSVERRELLRDLAADVNTTDLARIIKAFPHILSEAVRELNGEVEYFMVNKPAPIRKV